MARRTALMKGSTLAGFEELARQSGADARLLMASAGLSDIYLRQPELYMPFYNFMKLLEIAAAETHRPLFGAELGFRQGITVLGSIARALETSATIGVALERLLAHFRLQTTGIELALDRRGSTIFLSAVVPPPAPPGCRQIHGQLCSNGIAILRMFAGAEWVPDEIHFAHPAPVESLNVYHRMFGDRIAFNAEVTALLFDSGILDIPLPAADPALHMLIRQEMDALAMRLAEDLPLQVETAILNELPFGTTNIHSIARALAMSQRSLQRHLQSSGTSFDTIFDRTRRDAARHYLSETNLSLTEVSVLLGYLTLSNFSHAFRRWHGVSPRQWRKSQQDAR